MEQTLKWTSPKSISGSFLMAVLAHAAVFGGMLALTLHFHETPPPTYTPEVAYESLAEPPTPAAVPKPLARTPEPETPVEKTIPDTTPKEMQDTSSSVAGTQKAAPTPVASTGATGSGDATATPYYKIKPKYPRAALVSGIEGWVTMRIDINEKGEVENVRVTGGEQRSMFEIEARRAVEKWKYKPFTDAAGKLVRKTDHEVRVDFRLKDA
jgi:protein TonB